MLTSVEGCGVGLDTQNFWSEERASCGTMRISARPEPPVRTACASPFRGVYFLILELELLLNPEPVNFQSIRFRIQGQFQFQFQFQDR